MMRFAFSLCVLAIALSVAPARADDPQETIPITSDEITALLVGYTTNGEAYQGWWSGGEDSWDTWWLGRDDGILIWIGHEGQVYTFEVAPGQQLIWPEE